MPALFGLEPAALDARLSDYFWNRIPIEGVAIDVTERIAPPVDGGQLVILPRVLWREWLAPPGPSELDQGVFKDAIRRVLDKLGLDWLVVETGAGLGDEALLSAASADVLLEVARPDAQDLQATAVMLGIAERLGARRTVLVVSQAPMTSAQHGCVASSKRPMACPLWGVLPLAPELAHRQVDLLAVAMPSHPWTVAVRRLVRRLGAGQSAEQRLGTGEWTLS
ncbi:MAG: hypothetical protein KatS3mg060_3084 [Dehalococcoidia bacterium]|nr:MAG: hypothetical protein KatS3mg060_3084 [Dehalococcoidia bacterium]